MGEREEPEGGNTGNKAGRGKDDADQAGMRPTGSGGSAPMTENM